MEQLEEHVGQQFVGKSFPTRGCIFAHLHSFKVVAGSKEIKKLIVLGNSFPTTNKMAKKNNYGFISFFLPPSPPPPWCALSSKKQGTPCLFFILHWRSNCGSAPRELRFTQVRTVTHSVPRTSARRGKKKKQKCLDQVWEMGAEEAVHLEGHHSSRSNRPATPQYSVIT